MDYFKENDMLFSLIKGIRDVIEQRNDEEDWNEHIRLKLENDEEDFYDDNLDLDQQSEEFYDKD